MNNVQLKIDMNNEELTIDVELYPEMAPISVKNFLKLVNDKYYDGIVFHRIIKDFMAQAGFYIVEGNSIGTKEEKPTIKGEFSSNGVKNELKHEKGVISMARTNIKDSASSQFFICTQDAPHLDGQYAAFGKVVGEESYKDLEKLNNAKTAYVAQSLSDFPYPIVTIKSIREK